MYFKDALRFLGVASILSEFVLVTEFFTQIDPIASNFSSYFVEYVGYRLIPCLLLFLDYCLPFYVLIGFFSVVFYLESS